MSWFGIPFQLPNAFTQSDTVIEVTKLPRLLIDTGFSWEGIIGSLIAGCIPAFIAWKTIKSNNDVMHRQIILSAQQKKIDELRELCASYLSIRSITIEYTDIIYQEYDGDRENIPLEIISGLRDDHRKMRHYISLIILIIGSSDPLSIELKNELERMDKAVNKYFDIYDINTQYSHEADEEILMSIFSKVLEREAAKVYS